MLPTPPNYFPTPPTLPLPLQNVKYTCGAPPPPKKNDSGPPLDSVRYSTPTSLKNPRPWPSKLASGRGTLGWMETPESRQEELRLGVVNSAQKSLSSSSFRCALPSLCACLHDHP